MTGIPNRLLTVIFLLGSSFFLATVTYANSLHKPIYAATLIYPPYQYVVEGKVKGIAVDLIKEAAHRIGVSKVEFSFYPWNRAVKSVEAGHYDLLFNAGKNHARQEWGYYVDSVLIMQQYVLFKRKGEQIAVDNEFNNMNHLGVGIRSGYLYGNGSFRKALDNGKFAYQVAANSTEQSATQLLNRRIDFFIGDVLPVMHYIQANNLGDKIDMILNTQDEKHIVLSWPTYMLMSKKKSTLAQTQALNDAMEAMKLDGTYQQILNRYIR